MAMPGATPKWCDGSLSSTVPPEAAVATTSAVLASWPAAAVPLAVHVIAAPAGRVVSGQVMPPGGVGSSLTVMPVSVTLPVLLTV